MVESSISPSMRILARTPAVMWRSDAFRSSISCSRVRRLKFDGGAAGAAGAAGAGAAGAVISAYWGLLKTLQVLKHHGFRLLAVSWLDARLAALGPRHQPPADSLVS